MVDKRYDPLGIDDAPTATPTSSPTPASPPPAPPSSEPKRLDYDPLNVRDSFTSGSGEKVAAQGKGAGVMGKVRDQQAQLVPAQKPSVMGRVRGWMMTPTSDPAKASNIVAMSESAGIPMQDVSRNYDQLMQEEIGGVTTRQSAKRVVKAGMETGVMIGLAISPAATVRALATFFGIGEAENLAVSKLKGKEWKIGEGRGIADLLEAEGLSRDAIDVGEFILQAKATGKVLKGYNKFIDKMGGMKGKERVKFANAVAERAKAEGKTPDEVVDVEWEDVGKQKALPPARKQVRASNPIELKGKTAGIDRRFGKESKLDEPAYDPLKIRAEEGEIVPAVQYGNKTYAGVEGDTHPAVMKANDIGAEAAHDRGFVVRSGAGVSKFMTRDQAAEWLEKNKPEVYDKWVEKYGKENELHSQELNKAKAEVEGGVSKETIKKVSNHHDYSMPDEEAQKLRDKMYPVSRGEKTDRAKAVREAEKEYVKGMGKEHTEEVGDATEKGKEQEGGKREHKGDDSVRLPTETGGSGSDAVSREGKGEKEVGRKEGAMPKEEGTDTPTSTSSFESSAPSRESVPTTAPTLPTIPIPIQEKPSVVGAVRASVSRKNTKVAVERSMGKEDGVRTMTLSELKGVGDTEGMEVEVGGVPPFHGKKNEISAAIIVRPEHIENGKVKKGVGDKDIKVVVDGEETTLEEVKKGVAALPPSASKPVPAGSTLNFKDFVESKGKSIAKLEPGTKEFADTIREFNEKKAGSKKKYGEMKREAEIEKNIDKDVVVGEDKGVRAGKVAAPWNESSMESTIKAILRGEEIEPEGMWSIRKAATRMGDADAIRDWDKVKALYEAAVKSEKVEDVHKAEEELVVYVNKHTDVVRRGEREGGTVSGMTDLTMPKKVEWDTKEGVGGKSSLDSAIDKVTKDLAPKLGVKISGIKYEDVELSIDPSTPQGLRLADKFGISKEEVSNAISRKEKFRVLGKHNILDRDGEKWSDITLFKGATELDVYHEFAHGIDTQGGLPGWTGTAEERATYIESRIAAGEEGRIAELSREGRKARGNESLFPIRRDPSTSIAPYSADPRTGKVDADSIGRISVIRDPSSGNIAAAFVPSFSQDVISRFKKVGAEVVEVGPREIAEEVIAKWQAAKYGTEIKGEMGVMKTPSGLAVTDGDGKLIGRFTSPSPMPSPTIKFHDLALFDAYRNRGLSYPMIEAMNKYAVSQGASETEVMVEAGEDHDWLVGLYSNAGFVEMGGGKEGAGTIGTTTRMRWSSEEAAKSFESDGGIGPTPRPVLDTLSNNRGVVDMTGVATFIAGLRDTITIDAIPLLTRAGVQRTAVQHAYARDAGPRIVNDLLSKVFPDAYKNKSTMSDTMDIINKDNILGGYDDMLERVQTATTDGERAKWQDAANKVAKAHDLDAYDRQVSAAKSGPLSNYIRMWEHHVVPEMDKLYNTIKGVDPNRQRSARGRYFQARVNLLTKNSGDKWVGRSEEPMPESSASSYRNPNVRRDPYVRVAQLTGEYSTDAHAILSASFTPRWNEATKINFYNDLVDKGVAIKADSGVVPPEGFSFMPFRMPYTNPSTGNTSMVEAPLYVKTELIREIRGVLGTDMPMRANKLGSFLTNVQLFQLADLVTHTKNVVTTVSRAQGAGTVWADVVRKVPILGTIDGVVRILAVSKEVFTDTPAMRAELAEMAKNGLLRPEFPATGVSKITRGQQIIHEFDTGARVVLNRFFDNLVDRGWVVDTPENRRSLIDQVGMYNKRLMGPLMRAAAQSGIAPFIVAGRNFNRGGRWAVTGNPGVEPSNLNTAAYMRVVNWLGIALLFTVPMMLNYLTTGDPNGRNGTKVGEWDLGMKEKEGKHTVIDLMQWTGHRRGLRVLGINSILEGVKNGQLSNQMLGKSIEEAANAATHPWVGPAPQFAFRVAMGKQMGFGQRQEALKIEAGGAKQYAENLRSALENQNPMIYGVTRPVWRWMGMDMKPYDGYGSTTAEAFLRAPYSAFGVKRVRTRPQTAAQLLIDQYKFKGEGMTAEGMEKGKVKREIMEKLRSGVEWTDFPDELKKKTDALDEKTVRAWDKESTYTDTQYKFKGLSMEHAMDVWKVANPEEREELEEIYDEKIKKHIKGMEDEDYERFSTKIQEAEGGERK